ncbi:hypothetical protein PPYR_00435 [Photinus pyralis]|uniref:THAP-type domain-containing protein n=2 Tax=Photinus pyralis TaxID=7054 RepID=A0A5N4B1J6_PHOPY|nr:hypothetical protein PPYR_00435 [Photinus pyralis]
MTTRCSYFLCAKSKRGTPGLRMFFFPVTDTDRCQKWIEHSGNLELENLSPRKLKKRFLCADHFERNVFLRRKLTLSAVPIPYTPLVKAPKTYSDPKPGPSIEIMEVEEIRFLTPEKKSHSLVVKPPLGAAKKLVFGDSPGTPREHLRTQQSDTRKKLEKAKSTLQLTAPRDLNILPYFPRALTRMQLHHKPRTPWLTDEKKMALSLYYKSPATYKYMRRQKVILPSPSTISRWLNAIEYKPGHNKKLFKTIALKCNAMSAKIKECVLAFDEMALKQCLEYNTKEDVIQGYEDLGELGRQPVFAKQALVFIIRGLYSSWKLPLSYYCSANGVKAEKLKVILENILTALAEIGVHPVAFVCDQSTTNQKLFKLLNVLSSKPYIIINSNKYYALFDAPHLIKSIRNNLLDGDFLYEGNRVSFNDIKEVFNIDARSKTGKSLPKLTNIHMNPNAFQKMHVKLAVQVLSYSVAATIRSAIDTGELKSLTANSTAVFVELINNVFDVLNSRQLFDVNPFKRALCDDSGGFVIMNEALAIMEKIQKVDKRGRLRIVPCFSGLKLTIQGVKMIYQDQKDKGYPFLLTARLNQDILENQFSIYRQRGGYNRNPTVRTFQAAFKANTIWNLLKPPKTSNYEADPEGDENLLSSESLLDDSSGSTGSEMDTLSSSSSSSARGEKEVSLEDCAVVYFAGYLVKKCMDKFKCHDCELNLSSDRDLTEETDILLFYKNFNINNPVSLKKPSHIQTNFTSEAMKTFNKHFDRVRFKKNLGRILAIKIRKRILRKVPNWFVSCESHKQYILHLLIRVLVYKRCKLITSVTKTCDKKCAKLTILQNL